MSEMKFNTDGNKLIEVIQQAVTPEIIEVDGEKYATGDLALLPQRPFAKALTVASLTGVVDYINENLDLGARGDAFVQVESPTTVSVLNGIKDREDRRFVMLTSKADPPAISFDNFIPKEDMMIVLQARFVDSIERKRLIDAIGNIAADEEIHQDDDGVSQAVTLVKGIRRSQLTLQNPYVLSPFRTFTEIDQPASPFILRLKKTDGGGIYVALFESDGGAWRNTARLAIKQYLAKGLPDWSVIA